MKTISNAAVTEIEQFFSYHPDILETENTLFEMFRQFMLSSNEEQGAIPSVVLDDVMFLVRNLSKLLRAIEPIEVVNIKQAS